MNQQPNPALKNTAIYVGNDEVLRKKAIEYYEANGYNKSRMRNEEDYKYIAPFLLEYNTFSDFREYEIEGYTIITLPTETETEYPKMMLVSMREDLEYKPRLVEGMISGLYAVKMRGTEHTFDGYLFAKPLPTTTLTVAELVDFYEKINNVKVEVKQNTTETTN